MEKKGITTDRGNVNREIRKQNRLLQEIKLRIKALLNWIRGIGKEEKAETDNLKSTLPPKENLLSVFESLIRKNADSDNTDLGKYVESYQFLKEKNIISVSELKESITDLRDKNYKTTRALKDTKRRLMIKPNLLTKRKNISSIKTFTKPILN